MHARKGINVLLVMAGLCLPLLILEAVLRLAGYNPIGDLATGERVGIIQPSPFPERLYEGVPYAQGRAWGADIALNAMGLRNREIAIPKPAGTWRIAVLGDSVTFGNYMAEADVYPRQFEDRLRSNHAEVEVINLGLGGYDTLQEVATFKALNPRLQADEVILGFCVNDIGIASGNLEYVQRLQRYGSSHWYRWRIIQWLRLQWDRIGLAREMVAANQETHFLSHYRERIADLGDDEQLSARMLALSNLPDKRQFAFAGLYASPAHVGRMRYAFEALAALTVAQGIPTTLLLVPFLDDDPESRAAWKTVYAIVTHEAERAGFSVVNPHDVFREAGMTALRQRPNDPIHPNAEGHRLMSEALHRHWQAARQESALGTDKGR